MRSSTSCTVCQTIFSYAARHGRGDVPAALIAFRALAYDGEHHNMPRVWTHYSPLGKLASLLQFSFLGVSYFPSLHTKYSTIRFICCYWFAVFFFPNLFLDFFFFFGVRCFPLGYVIYCSRGLISVHVARNYLCSCIAACDLRP